MKHKARIVIIGAGIVGCSTAYHLSKLGWSDIVVVEQGPLFETGGSTSHAPGLVFQTNPARTMSVLSQDTVELYSNLELEGKPCYYPVGSMEVAWTTERLEELKRRVGVGTSYGLNTRLITANEALEQNPFLSDKILGAMFVEKDGIAKAVRAAEAMSTSRITKDAVDFYEFTKVTDIHSIDGRVTGVETDKGSIQADIVLSTAGIWGPKIGQMVGITVPQRALQHCYAKTVPLKELEGQTEEVTHPVLRHQDKAMYFRQQEDVYGIGSYNHPALPVNANDLLDYEEAPVSPSIKSFTPEHFEAGRVDTGDLLPVLKDIELTYKINGIFSFTVDGFPILGEWPQVKGFWSAEAVWITHAGGVGKIMAQWLESGDPGIDTHEMDVARFNPHNMDEKYIDIRASQNYIEVYDIVHPLQQIEEPRNIKLSPFHKSQKELKANFVESAGWERPNWFDSNKVLLEKFNTSRFLRDGWENKEWSPIAIVEHLQTRSNGGLFDLTSFTKIEVKGKGSLDFLNYLASNDLDKPVGKVIYTSLLTESGGIKCDLTITRLEEERFLVVTGGGMGLHDLSWIRSKLPVDSDIEINDLSDSMTTIGVWGPKSRDLLQKISGVDLSNPAFPYMSSKTIPINGIECLALRISYVGELGWEIYGPITKGQKLWDSIYGQSSEFGVVPVGLAAFESLRVEKGYRLWGNELSTEYNPYESGIGFAVKLDKGDFIGREALIRHKKNGLKKVLACITFDKQGAIVMGKEPIMVEDKCIGYVTSASYGYSVDKGIVYGYLPVEYAEEGRKVDIMYFGKYYKATVSKEPLFDPKHLRLKI